MRHTLLVMLLFAALAAAACDGGGGGGGAAPGPGPAALSITTSTLAQGVLGQAYGATVTASGGSAAGYTWTISAGALPAGLALSPTGTPGAAISGTPAAAGMAMFTVRVTDSLGATATRALQINVLATPPLSIVTTTLPQGSVGPTYMASVVATGGSSSGYTWNVIAGALPGGLGLSASGTPGATISGIPTAGGIFNFTVEVTDSALDTATAALQIEVLSAPPLSITSGSTMADGTVGVAYSQPVTATGGTAASYTWAVIDGELPPGLSLGSSGTPSTALSGTPTAFGCFYFTVQVTDSAATTATLDVTLIVVAPAGADSWVSAFNLVNDRGGPAVFTGSRILQFGGRNGAQSGGEVLFPGAGSSTAMATTGAPSARSEHGAVWTGKRMLLFGGHDGSTYFGDTFSYDPVADAWTTITASGGPSARADHSAVWTGSEMIVWGGVDNAAAPFNDGYAYKPATNTWRKLADAPVTMAGRERHKAVWTGSKMIVWGGHAQGYIEKHDGGMYDPATDTWTSVTETGAPPVPSDKSVVVWNNGRLFVAGGDINPYSTGAQWDPATNTWSGSFFWSLVRREPAAVATSNGVFVWGGLDLYSTYAQNDGENYSNAASNWVAMAGTSLYGRFNAKAFWTGRQVIVWGGNDFGFSGTPPFSDGAVYNP